jgi:hypothetical protein
MLDLGFVRGNLELVEEKLRARGADPAALLGDFRVLDQSRREAITTSERLKARRNDLSQQVGALKKSGQDATAVMDETRALKDKLDELDKTAASLDDRLRQLLAGIPNLTRDEVPTGKSEADNPTLKTWGDKPAFDFEPKPHWELGEALGILDLERATKLSGARFAVYMGAGARLERALVSFMLDLHTTKHGYTEVLPPFMVNSKSLFGTGQLPKFAEDLFRCSDADVEAIARGEFKDSDHWTTRACPSGSRPTRPVFAPRQARRARTRAASSASISFKKWSWSNSSGQRTRTPSTSDSPVTRKRFSKPSACPIAAFFSAPATPASPPPRPSTSRSGSPASNFTGRFLPALILKVSRRDAPTFATGRLPRPPRASPSLSIPSMAAGWP